MKKFCVLWLTIVFVAAFAFTTYLYSHGTNYYSNPLETASFVVMAALFVLVFSILNEKSKTKKQTAFLMGSTAILFTVAVFLINNFWKFFAFNSRFDWEDPLGYGTMLIHDISYGGGYAEFRYPLAFAGMILLCVLCLVWPHFVRILKDAVDGLFESIRTIVTPLTECLDVLCENAFEKDQKVGVVKHIFDMPVDEESKAEVIECAERYQEPLLYFLLIEKFGEILTKDEYIKYRSAYLEGERKHIEQRREYYEKKEVHVTETMEELDKQFEIGEE